MGSTIFDPILGRQRLNFPEIGPAAGQAAPGNTAATTLKPTITCNAEGSFIVDAAQGLVQCSRNHRLAISGDIIDLSGVWADGLRLASLNNSVTSLTIDNVVGLSSPVVSGTTSALSTLVLPTAKYFKVSTSVGLDSLSIISAPELLVFDSDKSLPTTLDMPKLVSLNATFTSNNLINYVAPPTLRNVSATGFFIALGAHDFSHCTYVMLNGESGTSGNAIALNVSGAVFLQLALAGSGYAVTDLTLPPIGTLKSAGSITLGGNTNLGDAKMTELLALLASLDGSVGVDKYQNTVTLTGLNPSPTFTGTPRTLVSVVGASTYVDVTFAAPHGLGVGDAFTVYGSSINAQNGTYRVASLDGVTPLTKLRYTKTAVGTSTGTPVVRLPVDATEGNLYYVHQLVKQGATVVYKLPA